MRHEQRFTVAFDYPVHFTSDVFAETNSVLSDVIRRREPHRAHRAAFVVDAGVSECFPPLARDIGRYCAAHGIALAGSVRVVPGGEACKNDPAAPARLAEWFDGLGLDRQSFVVVVGGGSVLDLVGYAAAVTHRGLRVVRVPTTVLSQNDSGIGVKNGVNAFGKKNFYGVFAPPFAVISDDRFLSTLQARDKAAGMAEAVKVALVKDREFFEWIEARVERLAAFDRESVVQLVEKCALLHLQHIATSGDPFELGSSRPLDFGHWAAHKLESLSNYSLRHGEAVAVGIALDTRYSVSSGLLASEAGDRVLTVLERIGLPTWHPELDSRDPEGGARRVLSGIEEFRAHLGGDLTVMMLRAIGEGTEIRALEVPLVEEAIGFLRARADGQTGSAPKKRPPTAVAAPLSGS